MYPDLVSTLSALSAFPNDSSVTVMVAVDAGLVPLTYHILNRTFLTAGITSTPAFVPTMLTNTSYTNVTGGQHVEVVTMDGGVRFFSWLKAVSNVTTADVAFSGGVIHIIDSVLSVPLNASATPVTANLTALAGALTTAQLVSTVDGLSDATIFAPTNEAFGAIANLAANISPQELAAILQYHVVQGTVGYSTTLTNTACHPDRRRRERDCVRIIVVNGTVFVNSAGVVMADVLVSNGVVLRSRYRQVSSSSDLHGRSLFSGLVLTTPCTSYNVINPMNSTATPDATASTHAPAFSGASSAIGVPSTSGRHGFGFRAHQCSDDRLLG